MLHEKIVNEVDIQYRWVSIDKISPYLAIAVIASEDQKFPHHYGFDFDSIQTALAEDRTRIRGASTISQQLAKNLYLLPTRSYFRKAVEAYFTVLIELFWTKQRILEVYLNVVEFGQGIYGAEIASQIFFDKSAEKLTIREASLLAAVLPNPKKMLIENPSKYVVKRSSKIEMAIKSLGGVKYLKLLKK